MLFARVCDARMRAEYVRAILAMWACEKGHVLDHAQDGDFDGLEHVNAFDGVFEGYVLRGGDDNRAYVGYDELYNENMQGRPYRQARFVA
jgi:hypothetical protein